MDLSQLIRGNAYRLNTVHCRGRIANPEIGFGEEVCVGGFHHQGPRYFEVHVECGRQH